MSAAALVDVEYDLLVLDHVQPGAREQAVLLPGVMHICIMCLVPISLLVQEIKHVLDGQQQG